MWSIASATKPQRPIRISVAPIRPIHVLEDVAELTLRLDAGKGGKVEARPSSAAAQAYPVKERLGVVDGRIVSALLRMSESGECPIPLTQLEIGSTACVSCRQVNSTLKGFS